MNIAAVANKSLFIESRWCELMYKASVNTLTAVVISQCPCACPSRTSGMFLSGWFPASDPPSSLASPESLSDWWRWHCSPGCRYLPIRQKHLWYNCHPPLIKLIWLMDKLKFNTVLYLQTCRWLSEQPPRPASHHECRQHRPKLSHLLLQLHRKKQQGLSFRPQLSPVQTHKNPTVPLSCSRRQRRGKTL